jgi:uncharacterized lipoprotein NlpE involved in copper resistance
MRIFNQQIKPIMAAFIFIATASISSTVFSKTVESQNEEVHSAQNTLDWPGIYLGFTPCDDCNGIKTTLALNKNNSYILITQFNGKSEKEIIEKGKFTSSDHSNIIILTSRDGTTSRQYIVGEKMLIQLDNNGNRFSGKLADRYILRRNDIAAPSQQHSAH